MLAEPLPPAPVNATLQASGRVAAGSADALVDAKRTRPPEVRGRRGSVFVAG